MFHAHTGVEECVVTKLLLEVISTKVKNLFFSFISNANQLTLFLFLIGGKK